MNFKTIQKAEQLRKQIEQQDKEINQLDRVMMDLATGDTKSIAISISITDTTAKTDLVKSDKGYASGGIAQHYNDGVFSIIQNTLENLEGLSHDRDMIINKKIESSKYTLDNGSALLFLEFYMQKLIWERSLTFKMLEECIRTLTVID